MDNESKFPEGFFIDKPKEGTPDFVKAKIGINVDKFLAWAKANENSKGYVNIDILLSKNTNKLYAQHNDWKPKEEDNGRTSPTDGFPQGIDMKNHPLNP